MNFPKRDTNSNIFVVCLKTILPYTGIILGAIYGIVIRVIWGSKLLENDFNLFSITFTGVIPIILSIFPILFSGSKLYLSVFKQILYPILTVALFLGLALATQLEDMICLLIIGLPYFLIAAISGMLLGTFVKQRIRNKALFSILLIPFVLQPIENIFPNQEKTYIVESQLTIGHSPEYIWPYLLEVPLIKKTEYKNGIFQNIGIPRPLYAKILHEKGQRYRLGTFTDGLILKEIISQELPHRFVNFKIDLEGSTLRNRPTDIHILRGNNFEFENISYTLTPQPKGATTVKLHCSYRINSKLNSYANFWAEVIIQDFEERLLEAIKLKLEKMTPQSTG